MQVKPAELDAELARGLRSVYLVTGDEPLLVMEACDAIVARARDAGFTERVLLELDNGAAFASLHHTAASLSLFAEKRIVEVRTQASAFDKVAGEALVEYLDAAPPDVLLLIRTDRLDGKQRSAAWYRAIDSVGVVVTVWPVTVRELPRWLMERGRRRGAELTREAADYLSWRVEGNLLAAAQEVEKLTLLPGRRPLELDAVAQAITDSSVFDSFDALDAALAGETRRVRHVVEVLELQGVQPLAVLGAVVSQLRRMLAGVPSGKLPPQRERALREAEKRLKRDDLTRFLAEASQIDQQCKGMLSGDQWRSLERLLLAIAGAETVGWLTDDAKLLRRED
jgi:DNA polymerase-3 subunit delta